MTSEHPLAAALAARPPWKPANFTRVMNRISGSVRDVTASIEPIERFWHELVDDTLQATSSQQPPNLWVVLGDSTSQGVGASTIDHSWVARLAAALDTAGRPHAILNLSRSGARTGHVLKHQIPLLQLLPYAPSIVTVGIGSNDLMRNPNPAALARRLTAIAGELPDGSIMGTLPAPSISPSARYVGRAVRNAADAHGHGVADISAHLLSPRKGLAKDRFHPNDAGYGAWVHAYAEPMKVDPDQVPETGTLTSSRPGPSTPGTTTSA